MDQPGYDALADVYAETFPTPYQGALERCAIDLFVDDVREAFAHARAAGLEIVHPLTDEPWGVTRFFYRGSDGRVINVGTHTA